MTFLLLALAISLPLLLGSALLRLGGLKILRGAEALVWLAQAWCLGFLLVGCVLFGWAWFALAGSGLPLLALLLTLAIGLHGLSSLIKHPTPSNTVEASAALQTSTAQIVYTRTEWRLFWAALLLSLGSLVDRANLARLEPILQGDEAVIWTAAARGLHASGGYTEAYGRTIANNIAHPDYPALNPLWQNFVFALEGAPEPFNSRLPMQAAALVLLVLVGGCLASRTRPAIAAAAVVALAGLHGAPHSDLVQSAYADGLVALALTLATVAWLDWHESRRVFSMATTAAGLALAVFAKNEGALYAAGFIGAAFTFVWLTRYRRPQKGARHLAPLLLLLAFIPLLFTSLVKSRFGLEGDLIGSNNPASAPIWITVQSQFSSRAPRIAAYILEHLVLAPSAGGALWIAFIATLVAMPRRLFGGPLAAPTTMVLVSSVGFSLIFIGSVHHLGRGSTAELWHLDTALVRVFGQMLPALVLIVSLAAFGLGQGGAKDTAAH